MGVSAALVQAVDQTNTTETSDAGTSPEMRMAGLEERNDGKS